MIQKLEQFRDSLSKGKITIWNQKLNNIIRQYHFFHWSDDDVKDCFIKSKIDLHEFFFSNVCKLNLIIIDQYEENNNQYFIIGQEKTIIILDQSSISLLNDFLVDNMFIKVCFLSNTEKIFFPLIQNKSQIVKINSYFTDEIKRFNKELRLNKRTENNDIWNIIKPLISAYLIQKGYQRSNYYRIYDFAFLYGYDSLSITNTPKIDTMKKNDYIVLRNIGKSNFAVDLVYHIETGILCALKRDDNNNESIPFLCGRETNNYLELKHPFMPNLISENKSQNEIFIEFIDGKRLDRIKGLTIKQKVKIIFELMITLEYIHRNHYVYRDLKPDNILVNEEEKMAILIDFDRMRSIDNISNDTQLSNDKQLTNDKQMNNDKQLNNDAQLSNDKQLTNDTQLNNNTQLSNDKQLTNDTQLNNDKQMNNNTQLSNDKQTNNDVQLTNDFGVVYYMPPELITVENAYKADIYTLGKVIYFIMNEKTPCNNNYDEQNDFKNYPKMKEIYENCTKSNFKERPTIKELILEFYFEFRPDFFIYDTIKKYFTEVFNEGVAHVIYMLDFTDFNPYYIYKFGLLFYEGQYVEKNIEKAIYYLDIATNYGENEARLELGDMYYKGIEVKQNIEKAIYYYTLNISGNDYHLNFTLGTIYYDNKFIPADLEKAIYYFKLAAEKGHDIACMFLADIYFKHDNNKTIHYLKIAADNGFTDAQLYLFEFLYNGKEVPQNIDMAIYYLKLAVEKNDPKAQYYLGQIFYDENDIGKAIYYLSLSANQNNSNAQAILGYIFYDGGLIKKDINRAINFFTLAANNNNTYAQYNLGIIFYQGKVVKKDINKAIFYFKHSANDYPSEANLYLGSIYISEDEKIRDINKALIHLKISAENNNQFAQHKLGIIYFFGYYVIKDIPKAIYYFEQAAKQNYLESIYMLGQIYILNLNNIDKGLEYLTFASSQNCSDSECLLGLLYSQGKHVKINYDKALKYFVSASNHGNPNAQFYLGIIYLGGLFGTYDLHKSFEYFNLSAKNNSRESKFFLGMFYFLGIYVKQNIKIALRYYVDSSNDHFSYAYFMAGFLYHILNDIKNAIYYYKQSSSLNACYAKNNLGIIYRKCESYQNIGNAIVYFEEAMKKAKDFIPFYNLANLYFFCNDNFIKSIEILIKCKHKNNYINGLLCLASMMEFGFEIENIKEELDKYDKKISVKICEMIKREHLNDDDFFEKLYDFHKENAFIYICEASDSYILLNGMEAYRREINVQVKDINESFYEGFGIEIA